MKITARSEDQEPTTLGSDYIGIMGAALDDRGRAAESFLDKHTSKKIKLEYFPERHSIKADNTDIPVDNFYEFFKKEFGFATKLLIEATTLSFPEIFICSKAFVQEGASSRLNFLYLEPGEYKRSEQDKDKRDFDLSEESGGFSSVPGALINIDDVDNVKKGIFFLGYEGHRLNRIYEELEKKPAQRCLVVFGVPAFKPGWETNAFSKNIEVMKERSIDGVIFSPANNPFAAYQMLCEHYSTLSGMQKMFVSPLGTKPEAIGTALFTAEKNLLSNAPRVGILFDNPIKKPDRSTAINKWHIYGVTN